MTIISSPLLPPHSPVSSVTRISTHQNTETTKSDEISRLTDQLNSLKQRQSGMSPKDYLTAVLSLKEQIATGQLQSGADLDVMNIKFEGRTYQLAGKVSGPHTLKAINLQIENQPRLATERTNGFDIRV